MTCVAGQTVLSHARSISLQPYIIRCDSHRMFVDVYDHAALVSCRAAASRIYLTCCLDSAGLSSDGLAVVEPGACFGDSVLFGSPG